MTTKLSIQSSGYGFTEEKESQAASIIWRNFEERIREPHEFRLIQQGDSGEGLERFRDSIQTDIPLEFDEFLQTLRDRSFYLTGLISQDIFGILIPVCIEERELDFPKPKTKYYYFMTNRGLFQLGFRGEGSIISNLSIDTGVALAMASILYLSEVDTKEAVVEILGMETAPSIHRIEKITDQLKHYDKVQTAVDKSKGLIPPYQSRHPERLVPHF